MVDFNLYLITDRKSLPPGRNLKTVVRLALEGGLPAVQLREKDLPAAQLLPLALELRELTRAFGAKLLVNDRIDVALAAEADGVHLGGHSLPPDRARKILGPGKLIGVSTHDSDEILAAAEAGADFVTFGPVFATPSKAAYGPPLGLDRLAEACRTAPLPVFALGGVTPDRLADLRSAGCTRLACIGAILLAGDPGAAVRRFSSLNPPAV